MKKSLLVASLLAVALAACGKKEEAKPAVEVVPAPAVVTPAPADAAPATPAAPAETTPVAPAAGDTAKKQ